MRFQLWLWLVAGSVTDRWHVSGKRELAGLGIEYTPDGRMGPQLGAQFGQLVKELRSEYGGAVTGCAQRISQAVFSLGPRVLTLLQQHGLTGNPAQTAQEVCPQQSSATLLSTR